jgi:50S ribosomal protein L16 3-hydroxylase
MTYSIGFRAPKTQELAHEFLGYLQDNLQLDGLYADPDLQPQTHPAEISGAMVEKVQTMLQKISWDESHVADFLGKYLTEPKLHIVFDAPKKLSFDAFLKRISTAAILLDLKSQMLFFKDHFYLNGERLIATSDIETALKKLADTRQLSSADLTAQTLNALANILHPAYLAGYITLE